ncbi:MAG: beta-galactosidase trimerization domain-containing protein, partial [Armatimonadota bacterium]|nr:beta-galactosidase trimerization domain-containing protein [Armatimonadota bacterium]
DGTVVPVSGPSNVREFGIGGHYWPSLLRTRERVLADLVEAVDADWDAIAMSRFPAWSAYPEEVRDAILDAVASGRGLMIGSLDGGLRDDLAARGLELQPTEPAPGRFPPMAEEQVVADVYRCGRGHVVHHHLPSDSRFGYLLSSSALQSDFERSAARAGWLLWRAARPNGPLWLAEIGERDGAIVVGTPEVAEARQARLDVSVRRRDSYEAVARQRTRLAPGDKRHIRLPALPTGEYQAELRVVSSDGTTLDWDVLPLDRAGPVRIAELTVSPDVVGEGDEVSCRLQVEGPTDGLRAVVRWRDQWNRLLLETQPEPLSEQIQVAPPAGSLSVLNHVEVTLISERGAEARATAEVRMPENVRPTDFHVLYWNTGVGGSWRRRLYYDTLRRSGAADAFANCGTGAGTARAAALVNLRTVPYTTAFHGVTLAGQLLNEQWLADMEERARETARGHRDYGALAYTLGDENYVNAFKPEGRFCDTPAAWAMFQDYLREVYESIEALNAQWDSDFGAWDEVRFAGESEMLPSLENPSAWVDYRMFISSRFAAAQQRMRAAIQEEHPGAVVGQDGAEQFSSYDGYDWWQLTRGMDLVQVYAHYLFPYGYTPKLFNGEAVGSFRPDAAFSGCWMNNTDLDYGGAYVPWYLALNGWNSVWWWHATFLHPANGACRWDLSPTPIVEDMAGAARELKAGPAALLSHATKHVDPIAVHYSENNWHASTIESGVGNHVNNLGLQQQLWMAPELVGRWIGADDKLREMWGGIAPKGHYGPASAAFYLLLHDLGFQPRTMARQEIEAGALSRERMKVLVLPFAVSLSDEELARIRAFVDEGGLVIADYRCGLRDLHGRLRENGPLDDVFGLERADREVLRQPLEMVADYRGERGARLPTVFREAVTGAGAMAHGYHEDGTPALLVHRYGEGAAVYLNADLYAYHEMRRRGTERDVRELMRALLEELADMRAPLVPRHKHGHAISATEVTRLADGGTEYVGLLRDFSVDDKSPHAVRLQLRPDSHVYDVRGQRYLGPGGRIEDTLEVGQPKMYAVLPYRVETLSARCPETVARGERVRVRLSVSGTAESLGPHAVRVEVTMPDDSAPEYLGRTLYLPRGRGSYWFVPALNAPAGRWRVSAVECVSGEATSVELHVR